MSSGERFPREGMEKLCLLIFWLGFASANVAPTSNNTVCEDICGRCDDAAKKTRCMTLCPIVKSFNHLCPPIKKYDEILIGITVGVILCIIFIMGGLLCLRFRKRKKELVPKSSAKDLKYFHRELDRLRPHAYTFLAILNNVRRQVRDMHRAGNTDAAVVCGRSLSDLAKILMLLNRKDIPIVPPEWPRLFAFAESILQRSILANSSQQPHVGQLVQFLQTPINRSRDMATNQSTPMSTLKPPMYEDYVPLQEQNPFVTIQNGKAEWVQQWEFPQDGVEERRYNNSEDAWRSRHSNASENVWVDDEFFMMTFRPQDEIVTVL